MEHSSMTRIECFEETHTWTIENWKQWLKVISSKTTKDKPELSALFSEKFCVPYAGNHGNIQNTVWQLKAFPEKDRHGKNTLKLKLVNHNDTCCIPPGIFDIKSEPLISFHSLVCFGFHWHSRPLDNTKAQFPVPHRWPKKNLKINVTVKLFVPIRLRSTLPDIVNDNHISKEDNTVNVQIPNQRHQVKTKYFKGKESAKEFSANENDDSLSNLRIPSAPSLMEPV